MAAKRISATSSPEPTFRRAVTTEVIALKVRFEDVTARLARAPVHQLDSPISHWAMASDRCLPYALLDRTVREIAATSFDNLLATAGVGQKKFASLVMLLQRVLAAGDTPPETKLIPAAASVSVDHDVFEPAAVSQVVWTEWQATVRRHQLQHESLGRLANSLQSLPTVIWSKQLGDYLQYTIDELRSLKTHGEKRVTAVLEVFHVVHGMLGSATRSARVVSQLTPAFVPPIEQWLYSILSSDEMPTAQDIRQHLVLPLLNQIERDAGETVHRLAAGRLGIESFPEGVRDQSRELGVTRARIYQLLETCGEVMQIRWPHGRWLFQLLADKLQNDVNNSDARELLESLQWLLYPARRANPIAEPAIA